MNGYREALAGYFRAGIRQSDDLRLGVELEHFPVYSETGESVQYSGTDGVRALVEGMIGIFPGAEPLYEDDLFGFMVPDFTITLEPGAQIEISIAPQRHVSDVVRIYDDFRKAVSPILDDHGIRLVSSGCIPKTDVGSVELLPKARYRLMDEYFRGTGTGGMEMMRGSASLQVSVDYTSEEDFVRKIRAMYFYSPALRLLCDNAAMFQGRKVSTFLKRTDIWRRVDGRRCGIPPGLFSDTIGFETYAEYIGNMPPIFIKEDGRIVPTGDKTVAELYACREMNTDDIEHVLSLAFPPVRLKKFIEIRFADSVPIEYAAAYTALIKGLAYSDEGTGFAKEIIARVNLDAVMMIATGDAIMENGFMAGTYMGRADEFCRTIIGIAERNLDEEEKAFLEPFGKVIEYGGIANIPGIALSV
ncbi:MAG: hypothetical protein K6G58_02765 [Lachnospiraceae bacterium]|nr:hypothetical protein [Lachnospiraceae bacterium]